MTKDEYLNHSGAQEPVFSVAVAAKKWAALQAEGYKMQRLCFARDGVTGTIDDWGKVLWEPIQPDQEPFGYFKPEPFGWIDCEETDEGARPLYEKPFGIKAAS